MKQRRGRLAMQGGVVCAGLVLALGLAGCSGADRGSGGTQEQPLSGADNAAPAAGQPGAEGKPAPAPTGGQPGAAPIRVQLEDRSIIRTGTISVRVDNVEEAAGSAVSLAERAGGFVAADKRTTNGARSDANLTLRVPADRFTNTVDELAKLGREESRGFTSEDVTEAVVDLDARIATQRASVDRTRALLARAQTIGEIVSIEAELAKREAELASLEARKRKYADLASLSTINVNLLGPEAAAAPARRSDPSFLAGLRAGWTGFVGAMTVLLAILGFVLPFALVLGVPAGAVWWFLRRRRSRGPVGAGPPAGLASPAPAEAPPA